MSCATYFAKYPISYENSKLLVPFASNYFEAYTRGVLTKNYISNSYWQYLKILKKKQTIKIQRVGEGGGMRGEGEGVPFVYWVNKLNFNHNYKIFYCWDNLICKCNTKGEVFVVRLGQPLVT